MHQKTSNVGTLGLRAWMHHVGTENVKNMAQEAKTSYRHIQNIAYSNAPIGYRLAKRIVEAAAKVTPGWAPDLVYLMERLGDVPPSRTGKGALQPSPEFIADQERRRAAGLPHALREESEALAA
ncbi:hypothetical protein [uncultured Aquabacterium sp.]|uniref:hypothetical protein n=1 Tax=uncultured Aquabacterium sp. TaxID=158753 RepID=UPI0025F1885A|nr:hypothetical protein [uncultured Aquabacterium sp.]